MKTVLIISFTNLASDPRVNRQIRWLSGDYRVVALGTADPAIEGVEFIPCRIRANPPLGKIRSMGRLLLRRFEPYYWSMAHVTEALQRLAGRTVDLVIANDIDSLPLALKVASECHAKVVLDAHEYAPREFEDHWVWRLLVKPYKTYLCREYLHRADAMVTVCQGIADEYRDRFAVRPGVITNAPDGEALEPQPTNSGRVRLIHHGGATPSRKIENMIRMMNLLDERFELDFMLVASSGRYLESLKRLASSNPRIRFLEPVPMREIVRTISRYDMGIYILEPNSFNNRMALPNKFFEFIQARLAVAIGPSPEMARIVRENDLGIVAEDFSAEALARALAGLGADEIDAYKQNSHAAAPMLSAEQNADRFLQLIARVIG